jgi:hypothetical protein
METVKTRHSMNSVPSQNLFLFYNVPPWIVSPSGDDIKFNVPGHYLRKYGTQRKLLNFEFWIHGELYDKNTTFFLSLSFNFLALEMTLGSKCEELKFFGKSPDHVQSLESWIWIIKKFPPKISSRSRWKGLQYLFRVITTLVANSTVSLFLAPPKIEKKWKY